MNSTSQFDGNAAFSGGGFMPSQTTQTTESSLSSSKNREAQTLIPLTVKQINGATNNSDSIVFSVDGVDINVVTVLGLVYGKDEKVTEVSFVVDDGTGRIDVRRWVNERAETNEMEKILDGMYVRVHGMLKGFQGKRHIQAVAVRPVTDFNELTYHFLECMYVHLYNTKMRATSVPTNPQMMSSVSGTPFRGYQGVQQSQISELNGVDKIVMDYLNQPRVLANEGGVHFNELMQRFGIPRDKLEESLSALNTEGLIYTTFDEYHYKSTANA